MNHVDLQRVDRRPPPWAFILAFTVVYLTWGTTYLAIKFGVGKGGGPGLPPALFGGTRIALASLVLFGYQWYRGEPLGLPLRDMFWMAVGGAFLFMGGNWLITLGQQHIDSSLAAVLGASTPLWIGVLETLWPEGDRLGLLGWLGLLLGLVGVFLLFFERLHEAGSQPESIGMVLALGSSFCWAIGSLVLRYHQPRAHHLTAAAFQMLFGGLGLVVLGISLGEVAHLHREDFTGRTVYAFFHLLVFGSLLGFVAFSWLLKHVSATLAGTYAYVNPVVAIVVGSCIDGEPITLWIVAGMLVILSGVALVRQARVMRHVPAPPGLRSLDNADKQPSANGPVSPAPDCTSVRGK